jgi:hypothetical protein
MNRPPLRLARPGQLPGPATGDDSLSVLTDAIDALARRCTPLLARRLRRPPARPSQPHRPSRTAHAPGRPRCPRPGTHLGPDRRAPRHHRRHGRPPLPEQLMINLTRITRIMPRRVHLAQGQAPAVNWHNRDDEQVKFPPLSCNCHLSAGYALPDLRPHCRPPARHDQRGPDRALPAGPSRNARPPLATVGRRGPETARSCAVGLPGPRQLAARLDRSGPAVTQCRDRCE